MTPITFSRKIDKKTFVRLSMLMIFQSRFIKVACSVCVLVIILTMACYGPFHPVSRFCAIIIATVMLLYAFRIFLLANSRYQSTPAATEEVFWKIDESGIEMKAASYNSNISWNAIQKITENNDWVFLWRGKSRCTYFQRDLVSPQELSEIKAAFFKSKQKGQI